jgi:hypothetical protein
MQQLRAYGREGWLRERGLANPENLSLAASQARRGGLVPQNEGRRAEDQRRDEL